MKIDRVFVYGWEPALYGMRNPKESWAKSDSKFWPESPYTVLGDSGFSPARASRPWSLDISVPELPFIGPEDLRLACSLVKAGSDHRKFLRQIQVWWNITLPRAIWQELDTFKVATVRNSCSTMHKLGFRDLTPDDFQDRDVDPDVLKDQNRMGEAYRKKLPFADSCTGEVFEGVKLLAHMKRRLPEGFLQMATYLFNYETALKMWFSRHDHRMPEWSGPEGICEWLMRLPYFHDFVDAVNPPAL